MLLSFGDGRTLEYVKFVLPSSCPLSGIFNGGWLFCRDPSFEVLKRMATDNCGALINCARCRDEATLEWMLRYSIYTVISFWRDFVHQQYHFEIFFPIEEKGGGGVEFLWKFSLPLYGDQELGPEPQPSLREHKVRHLNVRGAQSRETAGECWWGISVSWLWKSEFSWTWWWVFYSFGTGLPVLGCICGLLGSMVSTVDVSRCF